MIPYFVATFSSCILLRIAEGVRSTAQASGRSSDVRAVLLVCLAAVPLILLIGLRAHTVGVDTRVYVDYFFDVCNGSADVMGMNNSPLFFLFTKLSAWLSGGNYSLFLLFEGILLSVFLFSAFWHDSEMPWLSLLMFLCFGYMFEFVNQYRQMLACAILLFAYRYYSTGRMGAYVLWILVASGIHPAALVMLIPVFMPNIELNPIKMLAAIAVMLIIGVGFPVVESFVSRIPYFGNYIGSAYDNDATATTIFNFLFRAGLFVVLYQKRDEVAKRSPKMWYVYPILLLGVMFQAAAVCSTAFGRLPTFAICHFSLLVPAVIKGSNKYAMRLLMCLCLFLALLTANLVVKDYSGFEWRLVTEDHIELIP